MSFDQAWEDNAATWAQFARSPQHDHFFWTFNGPAFLQLLPAAGRRTLDVACGEGRLGRLLGERGHRVVGLDASPSLARLAHTAGGQAVLIGDGGALPIAARSMDLVTAFMSLHDIPELDPVVAEVARVLAPQGCFCLAIAHPIRSSGQFAGNQADSDLLMHAYFDRRPWPWRSRHTGMLIELPGVHRALGDYTGALERSGFAIEAMREPRPTDADVAGHPESARWQRIPCFLHIRAVRR